MKIHIDILEGVVVVRAHEQKQIIPRDETTSFIIETSDHPEAEQPDENHWEPLQEAELYQNGKKVTDSEDKVYKNNLYTVIVKDLGHGWLHLSIRRNDRHWARDWRHFQRIKNELAGEEREAVELYPAESRLVDEANQYHLWVAPPGERFPFGYGERLVRDESSGPDDGFRQRPR